MELGFKDRVVMITGSGSAIGQDMAAAFAAEGARVAVNDVNVDGIAETLKMIEKAGGAGMAADLQAVSALGAHPAPVITSLTVQDTRNAYQVVVTDAQLVADQAGSTSSPQ